jgi:hypothetical protein
VIPGRCIPPYDKAARELRVMATEVFRLSKTLLGTRSTSGYPESRLGASDVVALRDLAHRIGECAARLDKEALDSFAAARRGEELPK